MSESKDLERVHGQLGRLEAQAEASNQKFDALFEKIDALQAQTQQANEQLVRVTMRAQATDKNLSDLSQHISANVDPSIDDYKRLKNAGMGVFGTVCVLAGGAGAGFYKLLIDRFSTN